MLKLILFLYRVVSVIGGHQRKLGPDLEENLLLAIHGFGNVLVKVMWKLRMLVLLQMVAYRNVSTNSVKPWVSDVVTPVWNPRAVIWLSFHISSLVYESSPPVRSYQWSIILNVFKKLSSSFAELDLFVRVLLSSWVVIIGRRFVPLAAIWHWYYPVRIYIAMFLNCFIHSFFFSRVSVN